MASENQSCSGETIATFPINGSGDFPPQQANSSPFLSSLKIQLFSSAFLKTSPHLVPLASLINNAFAGDQHIDSHKQVPPATKRLQKPDQFIEELGQEGFTFIAFKKDRTPIATASAKPYTMPNAGQAIGSATNQLWKRKANPEDAITNENLTVYEIILLAVLPPFRAHGLASHLLTLTIEQCKSLAKGSEKSREVKLLLSTSKERGESFYQRKGFLTTGERKFGRKEGATGDEICVVDMEMVGEC